MAALERVRGLEPLTSTLGRLRSTTELYPRLIVKIIKSRVNIVKISLQLLIALNRSGSIRPPFFPRSIVQGQIFVAGQV